MLGVDVKVISINDTHQFIASVVIEEKLKKEAEAFLESFKKIGKELDVHLDTELISGVPSEEIVKYANEDDLLIIANQGKKGIDRFILGSISQEVIRNAPCSVLVVKVRF
jgi:nucleotide-binding universal stress UspA family protein